MTYQRIRLRTDIFQSQEFALMEERTVGVPLILPEPAPSIRNIFNHIDEPEVICLGNGKDWDYNDNRSSKDPPYPTMKVRQKKKSKKAEKQQKKKLKMLLEKGIDFWNGSYSCLVCQIELQQSNIHEHLQGFQHAMRAATREKEKNEKESKLVKKLERQFEEAKKLNECKKIDDPEVICLGNDNDERSSEDLPNPTIKDKMILDGLSALDVWLSKVERKQALKINESKKTKKNH